MPDGGTIAGLGLETGLVFGAGSRFGVGLGLGLGPRRLQALNPQQCICFSEVLSGVQKGGCHSRLVFGFQGQTTVFGTDRGGLSNPFRQLQPGLGHATVSFQVPS